MHICTWFVDAGKCMNPGAAASLHTIRLGEDGKDGLCGVRDRLKPFAAQYMTSKTNVLQAESAQGCHSVMINTRSRKRAGSRNQIYIYMSLHSLCQTCSVVNTDTPA
jgi:hypothetical protein